MKVLDYLACGLPVISTDFGMRGYDNLKPFVHICRLEEFQLALQQKYYLNPKIYQLLEDYSWDSVGNKLKKIYTF